MKGIKRMFSMLVIIVIIFGGFTACDKISQSTWQEQYDLGMQYLEDGDYEQAIVAFTAAIELDPKQAPIYIGRAQAYIGSGETEENLSAALTDYESALALDDMNPDIYLGIADVYIRQGDYEKAKEILNRAIEKLGENEAIRNKIQEIASENTKMTEEEMLNEIRQKYQCGEFIGKDHYEAGIFALAEKENIVDIFYCSNDGTICTKIYSYVRIENEHSNLYKFGSCEDYNYIANGKDDVILQWYIYGLENDRPVFKECDEQANILNDDFQAFFEEKVESYLLEKEGDKKTNE